MKVIAIIPARGGSKRLKDKNIFPLKNKPLIAYTIEACRRSKYINEVFVDSDSQKILDIAEIHGAKTILRNKKFANDKTPKITAIRQSVHNEKIKAICPDIIVIAQANSPQIDFNDIDKGIELLLENNLWEVMSANKNGIQNAAFRIILKEHLNNDFLSAHCGFIISECIDVHTIEDIKNLEKVL